jgi:flagellin-specific chaperone FliS
MKLEEIIEELIMIKEETGTAIQHSLSRISRCKKHLVEHNDSELKPMIDILTELEKTYKAFL